MQGSLFSNSHVILITPFDLVSKKFSTLPWMEFKNSSPKYHNIYRLQIYSFGSIKLSIWVFFAICILGLKSEYLEKK